MDPIIGRIVATAAGLLALVYVAMQIGGLFGGNKVTQQFTVYNQLHDVLTTNYQYAAGSYGTTAFDPAYLIRAKAVPSSAIQNRTSGTLQSEWKGSLVVTGNNGTFFVDIDNIPADQCIKLVSSIPDGGNIKNVGATAGSVSALTGLTLTAAALASGVQAACTGDTNAVRVEIQA